jgi:hypothetical protein
LKRAAGVGATLWSPWIAFARATEPALARAADALESGRIEQAQDLLQQLIAAGHSPAAELLQVRVQMQRGQYQQALALAAHIAGEAEDEGQSVALYAWLLDRGGQPALAKAQLAAAVSRWPGSIWLNIVSASFGDAAPKGITLLRPAAHSTNSRALGGAGTLGSAVLLPGGRTALGPALAHSARAWVRNGLGETVPVQPVREVLPGLALWRLDLPLASSSAGTWAPRDAFGGAPGATAGYAAQRDAEPQWPLMRCGFLGSAVRDEARRRLGFDAGNIAGVAPVLDAASRVVGVTVSGPGGPGRWWPVSSLLGSLNIEAVQAPPTPFRGFSAAAVYEQALRVSLQVLTG